MPVVPPPALAVTVASAVVERVVVAFPNASVRDVVTAREPFVVENATGTEHLPDLDKWRELARMPVGEPVRPVHIAGPGSGNRAGAPTLIVSVLVAPPEHRGHRGDTGPAARR